MSVNHPKTQGTFISIIEVILLPTLSKLLSGAVSYLNSYTSEYKTIKEKSDDINRISFEEINDVHFNV